MNAFSKLTFYLAILTLSAPKVFAAIPPSAMADSRFKLGYLVVTYYPGVMNDATGDATAGINEAIVDAFNNNLVVFFPEGTYQVTDVIKCFHWAFWDFGRNRSPNPTTLRHVLKGASTGASRPVIKLAQDAPLFDNPSIPRPVVVWRYFTAINSSGTTQVQPDDPLTGVPPNYVDQSNVIFGWVFRDIDIDVNGHSGAIGGSFFGAQNSGVFNVSINAQGGQGGIYGVPGRNSFVSNIEINGGRYGINNMGAAGSCLVGAKFVGQTEFAISTEDFCPYSVVGFEIVTSAPQAIYLPHVNWFSSGNSTLTLVDGTITMEQGGTALNNENGRTVHLNNVYINNASHLIQSGDMPPITGSADWWHINEYTYTDQRPSDNDDVFVTYSLIDGIVGTDPEPLTDIEKGAPPDTLTDRHFVQTIPVYEGADDGTVVVTEPPYNAKGDGATNDWQALQSAIDENPEKIIFLPKGNYVISKPLTLSSTTRMIGVDQRYSKLYSTSLWTGGTGSCMIETVDDPDATTFFGFIGLEDEATAASNATGGYIHWKAGRNSMIMMTRHDKKWGSYYSTLPRYNFWFSNSAGGRHFINVHQEEAASSIDGRMVYIHNTHQPLTFYGLNVEATKSRSTYPVIPVGTNIEISNAANVRIHSIKREGSSPTVIIRDSRNIAIYGIGRQNVVVKSGYGGYNQIKGSSDNVLLAGVFLDSKNSTGNFAMLEENLTGHSPVEIKWPANISIYKRGEISDIYKSDPVTVNSLDVNSKMSISCYPNPATRSINFEFNLKPNKKPIVQIFNARGEMVRSFHTGELKPGMNVITWDGKSYSGLQMPPGIYFFQLKTADVCLNERFVLLSN